MLPPYIYTITGSFELPHADEGRATLSFKQSSEILVILYTRGKVISVGCGQTGPGAEASTTELGTGSNGSGGANRFAPLVSLP